jgi:hypothetical protein
VGLVGLQALQGLPGFLGQRIEERVQSGFTVCLIE